MADKKPIYNPTAGEAKASAANTESKDAATATKPAGAGLFGRRLGVGAVIGLSAAGLAVLIGAGAAGAAISNAIEHADRGPAHVGEAGHGQMLGQGDGEGREGRGDGDGPRGGQMGDGQMGNGMKGDKMPHQHDANGNDIMPDGQMPGGPMPGGMPPNGELPPTPGATTAP